MKRLLPLCIAAGVCLSGCISRKEVYLHLPSGSYQFEKAQNLLPQRYHAGDTNALYQAHTNMLYRLRQLPPEQQKRMEESMRKSMFDEERMKRDVQRHWKIFEMTW